MAKRFRFAPATQSSVLHGAKGSTSLTTAGIRGLTVAGKLPDVPCARDIGASNGDACPQLGFRKEGHSCREPSRSFSQRVSLQAQDDMEVSTKSDDVKQAHKSVQEFLLLNHPVDCPICDQAGECKLQDYWLEHQTTSKRKTTEPVHKPKGVRFGETIVYDAERCVMCTRCIRFCDEVAGDHVLDMRERGNKNEIVLAPGRELDHRYTADDRARLPRWRADES